MEPDRAFRFAYDSPVIRYGSGSVRDLGTEVRGLGYGRALVVTGGTTGADPAVMEPVRRGLGDGVVGEFTGTTAEKRLSTATRCAERLQEEDADVVVAVGSGSSVDVARVASVVAASHRTPSELGSQLAATGTLPVPDDVTPVVVVPTTLAGAGLSMLAGVSAAPASGLVDAPADGGVGGPALMPPLAVYDPELVAATPDDVLAGSAMNGFDKGVEALYASTRTPITDATAVRGLRLLADALPAVGAGPDAADLAPAVRGVILVQYGTAQPNGTAASLLHAIGHGLRVHADVQLGVAHAAVAPDALAWLFEAIDGRRQLLAEALGVAGGADDAADVVAAIRDLRAELGVPARLRAVDGVGRDDLDAVAATAAGGFIGANDAPGADRAPRESRATAHGWSGTPHPPPELNVSEADVVEILEAAW